MDKSVFEYMTIDKPTDVLSLLPNVQHVTWSIHRTTHVKFCTLFLPSHLSNLTLSCHTLIPLRRDTHGDLFDFLRHLQLSVQKLELNMWIGDEHISASVAAFIRTLSSLQTFKCFATCATSQILSALINLSSLTDYSQVSIVRWQVNGVEYTFPRLLPHHFPSLTSINLVSKLEEGITSLESWSKERITTLRFSFPQLGILDINTLGKFFHTVSRFPRLQHLRIVVANVFAVDQMSESYMSFRTIRPLLACQDLQSLVIKCGPVLTVTEGEIAEMGASWREMRELWLCSEPLPKSIKIPPPNCVMLVCLMTLAELFSIFLQNLGIHIYPPNRKMLCAVALHFVMFTQQMLFFFFHWD